MLQGPGVIRWPATSTMIDQRTWVIRGGGLALLGAILIGGEWRLSTRARRRAQRQDKA